MKSKSLILLAVAAGCGLVAMIGVQQMLSGGKTKESKVKILIAKVDIDSGVKLDKSNVGFKEWPKDAIPEGAVTSEEEYSERAYKTSLGPGQPVLSSGLGEKGKYGTALHIPDGMQVVSVAVNSTMTHSGLLKPGNYVDISAAIETPSLKGGGKRTEVKKVLQCVKVFAVGDKVVGDEDSADPKAKAQKEAKNVSFLVFPMQAQLLMLADKKSKGTLQFALRAANDKAIAEAKDLTEQQLSMASNELLMEPEQIEAPAEFTSPSRPKPSSITKSVKKTTVPTVTTLGDQASRGRTWKIEVFNGEKRDIQEIDWPDDKATGSKSPVAGDPSNGWTDPLLKFFSGRSKQKKSAEPVETSIETEEPSVEEEAKQPVKHRPSSMIRRVPEKRESTEPVSEDSSDNEDKNEAKSKPKTVQNDPPSH